MNCKPGDLAVIVSAGSNSWGMAREVVQKAIGRIVRVVELRPPHSPESCTVPMVWQIDDPFQIEIGSYVFTIDGVGDSCLRPIRDPGDDATDEMVQLLGKPSEVTA